SLSLLSLLPLPLAHLFLLSQHFRMVEGSGVSSLKSCLICATPVTVPHYGIDSCRACASFFKRAKLSGKTFVCRQGDNDCAIVKDERFMCRRCRYDRCVAAGMVYDKKHKKDNGMHTAQSSSPDSDDMKPSTSREPEEEPILKRIGRQFNASVDRRRKQELQLLHDRFHLKFAPHPTQQIYWGNYETSVQLFHITLHEAREFYEKAFPALTKLSVEEQNRLMKSYIPKFNIIDNMHRSRKVWGEIKRFVMTSVVTTVEFTRPDLWLGEEQGGKNRQALVSCLHAQNQMQLDHVMPMYVRAQITNKEFYAVLALMLCDVDPSVEMSDYALSLLDEIRLDVFEDLQRYYKNEMGLYDYSTRLGHLISLCHVIQECLSLTIEFLRFEDTMFDLLDTHEKIKE
ncbi:hypothetical protein PFISCL1PPCAC_13690, partial [Pristionchus fissidentatus]